MRTTWRLLDLDALPGVTTQTIYHTVGKAMEISKDIPNTIIICWPENPIVCIGYHQILEEEVDLEYCKKQNIPVIRRPLGGGAVYLDEGQLFYQVIARLDSKSLPREVGKLYSTVLQAPVNTYQKIGINAQYAPINDIEADGKKISGNGAAEVNGARILTGNLIFDFNFDEMAKILKVPDEKFRDKVAKSLQLRLGTIKQFLVNPPERQKVKEILIDQFEKTLGITFTGEASLTKLEKEINEELLDLYQKDEWLLMKQQQHSQLMEKRKVKISTKTQIYHAVYKASGGLIRLFMEIEENKIADIIISGDFTTNPMDAVQNLEQTLLGAKIDSEIIEEKIAKCYRENSLDIAGVAPKDFSQAIEYAIKDLF
jgi:lipoate-protein ligase A